MQAMRKNDRKIKREVLKMNYQIIDLTDYSMLPFDGYQSFYLSDVERVFKSIPKKLRLDYHIEKDVKPSWWYGDKWRQTWTIRKIFINERRRTT